MSSHHIEKYNILYFIYELTYYYNITLYHIITYIVRLSFLYINLQY